RDRDPPAERRALAQDDRADLVRDARQRVARGDHRVARRVHFDLPPAPAGLPRARTPPGPVPVFRLSEVGGSRADVELLEEPVFARIGLPPRDGARRIGEVAERDRLGGADLLARRADLAVADGTAFLLRVDARLLDALHAVRALLHDA